MCNSFYNFHIWHYTIIWHLQNSAAKSGLNGHTAGKISIEHVTIFPSKYISKGAVDMEFSPDVGNNQSNP